MAKPIEVTFTYMAERDPLFWAPAVPVELRAEVSFALDGEPTVVPLERARWEDELGPEVAFGGKRNGAWDGADEAAVGRAVELLSQQATRESNGMAVAS